jgi:hypothetical protein
MFHDSVTVSCFLVFFNSITLFFNILTSSADFSGWFRLKGKSCKTFYIISTNPCVCLNFGFGWVSGGAAARQPLPALGAPLATDILNLSGKCGKAVWSLMYNACSNSDAHEKMHSTCLDRHTERHVYCGFKFPQPRNQFDLHPSTAPTSTFWNSFDRNWCTE